LRPNILYICSWAHDDKKSRDAVPLRLFISCVNCPQVKLQTVHSAPLAGTIYCMSICSASTSSSRGTSTPSSTSSATLRFRTEPSKKYDDSRARNFLVEASFSTFDHRGPLANCNRSIDKQQRGGK
jgi:hypothetical protein